MIEHRTEFVAQGRKLATRDLIRVWGEGSRLFKIRHLVVRDDGREWIEAYGPVDCGGTRTQRASYRSFSPEAVVAKARSLPPR